ncbi:MAG: hypothetical protein JXA95_13285 [Spirochaetales bacterium]|nr:hypothetical protein [Spirochaetales bacterium]
MPLPMIHLAVAREVQKNVKIWNLQAFLVGNIAPDAIHMRENTTLKDKSVTHLITDYIWFHTIFRRFEKSMPDRDDEDFIRAAYYYDTDHLDTKLYYWSDWTPSVMQILSRGRGFSNRFLSEAEIDEWTERTLKWFSDNDRNPDDETKYIFYEDVQSFIQSTSEFVTNVLADWQT